MRERLTRRDVRFLAFCLLSLLATVWFSAKYFYRAFPEASIDFAVSRTQAQALAEQFLRSQGHSPSGYRQASRFSFDNDAKTFLERELGLEKANQIMGRRVRLWRWSYRWFRPLQKEEYRVDVTPSGQIAGFQHLLAETDPGARLSSEGARSLAEKFLSEKMGRDPARLEFVESSSVARPARTDQIFTWRDRDLEIRDATYRFEITVAGGRIGGFREYLKIPETWTRDYERLRSRNEGAQAVDTAAMVLLAVGALATLLIRVGNRDVRWRRAGAVGGIGAALIFLAAWNGFPEAEFGYPTTDSYASFLASQFLRSLIGAMGGGALLFVLTAAAEPLYRQSLQSRVSLGNLFRWRGMRTKSFFLGSVLGFALTGFFVAYQTGFYLVAYRFGAWSPADVPYDELLNTRFPWLFVLLGGFFPAVSEEFLFRMFSIPFLQRLLRSTWLAVILAGFIWGFGHSAYPQQPFFIRGVEVGIGGVALGLVMLRWGILPALVWHYSVDALYTALLLFRSHNPYFILSGAASVGIVLLPLAVAGIASLRRKGFEPESGITNEAEGTRVPAVEEEVPSKPAVEIAYTSWSTRRRATVAVLLACSIGFLLLPLPRLRDSEFRMTASKARAAADAFLLERSLDPQRFRSVTVVQDEFSRPSSCCGPGVRPATKYFLERRPASYLKDFCWRLVPLYSWNVRYYRPLEKEEIRVSLHPESGKVIGFEHRLPEDQPGATLPPESAQSIAAAYLVREGFDLTNFELQENTSENRKARRDYTLSWEAGSGDARNVDEARFRLRAQVAGDRVTGIRALWKLPEAFVRERARRNALGTALLVIRGLVIILAVGLALRILVERTRNRQLRWRSAFKIALGLAVLTLVESVLEFPLAFEGYDTAISLQTFEMQAAISVLIVLIGSFLATACAAGLLMAVEPDGMTALRAENRRRLGLDALLAAALGVALLFSASSIHSILQNRFHAQAVLGSSPPANFALSAPAAAVLAGAPNATLARLAVLALAAFAVSRIRRRWVAIVLGLLVVAAMTPGQVHTPGEFALEGAAALVTLAVLAGYCLWVARDNYLAYALAVGGWVLMSKAVGLLAQPAGELQRQGWLVVAGLVLTVIWAVAPAFGRPSTAPASTAPRP